MQILEQKQKPFTTVILRSSSHHAGRWCQKERPVVGLSVIESGEPKSGWSPEDQKCRRKRPPVVFKQRCLKGREIRTPLIVFILKCCPCRIDNVSKQPNRRKKSTNPPDIFTGCFQKRRIRLFNGNTILHVYWLWMIQMLQNIKDTTH